MYTNVKSDFVDTPEVEFKTVILKTMPSLVWLLKQF